MAVAPTTASVSGTSNELWCLLITSSIRYRVEPGSTKPATRLMTIRTRPSDKDARGAGRTIAQISGHSSRRRSDAAFFGVFAVRAIHLRRWMRAPLAARQAILQSQYSILVARSGDFLVADCYCLPPPIQ